MMTDEAGAYVLRHDILVGVIELSFFSNSNSKAIVQMERLVASRKNSAAESYRRS
jgi:hypothetical protein